MVTNEAASEFGRLGGMARVKKLTAEQRREIARHAARVRWAKTPKSNSSKRRKEGAA